MSSYGLWLSAAGMQVNQHRQTILANNMANANTTGFKHDLAVVTQRSMESVSSPAALGFVHPVLDGLAGGMNVRPTYHNFSQGSVEHTGRPLDVAIDGEGFFSVSDGEVTRYTRDGGFAINSAGELVLTAGEGRWKVLDKNGARIVVDRAAERVQVSADGTISQGRTAVATLGLFTTDDKQSLRKKGENLFEAGDAEMTPVSTGLVPESREASNFGVLEGLVPMIEIARAYQLNATMLQLQDQLVGQAVSTVGRVA